MTEGRRVREVIGGANIPMEKRARVVVAEYDDGSVRQEIEVVQNEKYVPRYAELDDF